MREASAIGYYNFGVALLDVARLARTGTQIIRFSDPIEFNYDHGLELILKADQRRSASSTKINTRFGHSLITLRNALSPEFRTFFELESGFDRAIDYLDQGHSGDFRNRYLRIGTRRVLPFECIELALVRIRSDDREGLIKLFGVQA